MPTAGASDRVGEGGRTKRTSLTGPGLDTRTPRSGGATPLRRREEKRRKKRRSRAGVPPTRELRFTQRRARRHARLPPRPAAQRLVGSTHSAAKGCACPPARGVSLRAERGAFDPRCASATESASAAESAAESASASAMSSDCILPIQCEELLTGRSGVIIYAVFKSCVGVLVSSTFRCSVTAGRVVVRVARGRRGSCRTMRGLGSMAPMRRCTSRCAWILASGTFAANAGSPA